MNTRTHAGAEYECVASVSSFMTIATQRGAIFAGSVSFEVSGAPDDVSSAACTVHIERNDYYFVWTTMSWCEDSQEAHHGLHAAHVARRALDEGSSCGGRRRRWRWNSRGCRSRGGCSGSLDKRASGPRLRLRTVPRALVAIGHAGRLGPRSGRCETTRVCTAAADSEWA